MTTLVERGAAKLVCIAHDVDPIELVLWLPQLCRRKNVPFLFVKGKAALGKLVHKKTATCVAVTDVNEPHKALFKRHVQTAMDDFNNNGGLMDDSEPILGHKSRLAEDAR